MNAEDARVPVNYAGNERSSRRFGAHEDPGAYGPGKEGESAMADRRRWKQRFARLVLVLELAGASGCLSFLHPVAPPTTACLEAGAAVPMDCRDHVHVFLINGVDPCRLANLVGVRDYVKSLGYINTYYGELTDWWWFLREVRRVHLEDSDARIVVIGYSAGRRQHGLPPGRGGPRRGDHHQPAGDTRRQDGVS